MAIGRQILSVWVDRNKLEAIVVVAVIEQTKHGVEIMRFFMVGSQGCEVEVEMTHPLEFAEIFDSMRRLH